MAAAVVTEVDPERIKAKARYQKMKGYELQKLLRADGKDPNGTKPQLVARLLDLIAPPPPPMPAQAMAAAPPPVVASSSSDDENDPEKQQQRQLWQQQQEEQQQELEPELHRAGRQAERMETVAEQQEGAEAACRAKYEACNEKQLRSLCASSWLDESGDKLALVERLVAYDEPEDGRAAPPPPQRRSPPATAQPAQGVSSVQASQQAVGDRASEKAEMGTLVEDKEQEEKEKEKEKAAEKAIRAELRPLKMRTLHRRAVAAVVEQRRGGGANEDKDDEEEDEDEVEEAAENTMRHRSGSGSGSRVQRRRRRMWWRRRLVKTRRSSLLCGWRRFQTVVGTASSSHLLVSCSLATAIRRLLALCLPHRSLQHSSKSKRFSPHHPRNPMRRQRVVMVRRMARLCKSSWYRGMSSWPWMVFPCSQRVNQPSSQRWVRINNHASEISLLSSQWFGDDHRARRGLASTISSKSRAVPRLGAHALKTKASRVHHCPCDARPPPPSLPSWLRPRVVVRLKLKGRSVVRGGRKSG